MLIGSMLHADPDAPAPRDCLAEQAAYCASRSEARSGSRGAPAGGGDRRPLPLVSGARAPAGTASARRSGAAGDGQLDGAGARANLPSDGPPPPARRSPRRLRGTPLVESHGPWKCDRVPGQRSQARAQAAARSSSRQQRYGRRADQARERSRGSSPRNARAGGGRRSSPARIHGCGPARSMRLARCSWKGSRVRSIGSRRTRIRQ